jgi:hypothetical protein
MRSQAWMHRQWFEGITSKVFFEVANLKSAVAAIGEDKFIHSESHVGGFTKRKDSINRCFSEPARVESESQMSRLAN